MATVTLNRPAANSTTTINELSELYVLGFPGKDAILTKEGDGLAYSFDDGGKIVIEGFYAENSGSREAKFEMDGREFDAEKFFIAMDEPDLIPAAGPAPKKEPADTNSYHEYDNLALASGIDHLNGLDYRSNRAFEYEETRREPGIINNDTDATTAYMQISQNTVEGSAIPSDPVQTPAPAPVEPEPIAPSPVAPESKPVRPAPDPVTPAPSPEPVVPEPDPVIPEPEPVVPAPDPVVPDPDEGQAPLDPPTSDPVVPTPVEPEIPTITAREDQIAEGTPNPVVVPGFEIVEVVKNGDKGTLEKDPETGEWSYVLKDPVDHPEPGKDTVPGGDTLVVKVKDPDGNETEIEIPVDIVDDTPEVGNDHNEVVSGNPGGVTGDVPFDFGADDGPDKDVTIKVNDKEFKPGDEIPGEHGKLVVDEDGSYKYIPDPKGVDDPETSTDEFTVIVKDSDGDEAEGKITIDIKKPEGPVADPAVIDEALLSENGANAVVSIDGNTIVEVVGNGNNGSLAQNENGEWIYELADNITHAAGDGKNTETGVDTLTIKVKDAWGNEYLVEKRIDVIDDVPEAGIENGEMTVVAGQQVSGGSLTVDFGEDDLDARSVTVTVGEKTETLNWGEENEISGEFGTLTIGKDGAFTYKANGLSADKTGGRDEFTFVVTDSDGDSVAVDANGQPLKISVDVTKPEPPAADLVEAKESGIKDNETSDVPDDKYEIVEVIENGEKGTLEQDPDTGEWYYTLKEPATHDDENPDKLPDGDTVKILVRTPDGNEFVIDQPITIVDDVPEIGDGTLEVKSGETGSGTVDKFDFGADNGEGKGVDILVNGKEAGTEIRGEHGTLTINDDGTYSYKANGLDSEHDSATDTFTVQIKDADGDTDTGTITVNITKPTGPGPDTVTLYEKDMSVELSVDGYTIIGVAEDGSKGTVSWGVEGGANPSYTLTDNLDHPVAGEADTIKGADTVKLIVRDANGNEYVVGKTINVVDDLPTASLEHEDYSVTLGKTVEISNRLVPDFGADDDAGKTSIKINDVEMEPGARVEGKYGVLTVGEDGKFTYKANPRSENSMTGTDEFTFTVTDSDGDSVSVDADGKPLTISIDVTEPQAPNTENIPVSEKGVDSGDPTPVPVTVDGCEIVEVVEDGNKGTLTQDDDGNWIYTPTEATDHSGTEDGKTKKDGDTVKIKVVDEDGNEFVIEQKFDILDDTPDAGSDEQTIQTGETVTSSVVIDFGADDKPVDDGQEPSITITVNGEEHKPGEEIRGEHGTLTIDEKGGYTYTADPKDTDDSTESVKDVFTVTVKDSDGDEAEGTITINVTKPAGPTEQEITVNERGLDDVADASESAAVDFGNYTIVAPESGKYEGGKGTLEKIDGEWRYTLSGNMDSGANAEGVDAERNTVEGADTIAVVVEDANHNRFTVNVKVNVIDDIPEAGITQSVSETTAGDAAGVTGSLTVDFGADDDGKTSVRISVNGGDEQELVRGQEISGKYGKLVVDADGGYKYVSNALGADETGGRDEFTFAVIDSDGDRVTVDEITPR